MAALGSQNFVVRKKSHSSGLIPGDKNRGCIEGKLKKGQLGGVAMQRTSAPRRIQLPVRLDFPIKREREERGQLHSAKKKRD